MEKDERFNKILSDPKFRRIPRHERKVKIDKRFQAMFEDSRFKVKCSVDKRGRPTAINSRENLQRYYDLKSSEESSSSENEIEKDSESEESTEKHINLQRSKLKDLAHRKEIPKKLKSVEKLKESKNNISNDLISSSSEEEIASPNVEKGEDIKINSDVHTKLRDLSVDYARGEGNLFSESSSSDEQTESENEYEEIEHAWGELDKDAETTEDSTSRLAVCNMNWDCIKSEDLMVLLSSFLPSGGAILRIAIYSSEFGLKCMKEEEVMGPKELTKNSASNNSDNEGEDHFDVEQLRDYELRRLRYYYAVVECDSVTTASHLYSECDGIEYESSSAKLDLRFIPNDTTFENLPRDECTQLPEQNKYRPQFFEASALCKSKFELSWDMTDPRRVHLSQRVWATKNQEVDDEELRDVLASSSGSEQDEGEEEGTAAAKYRALLQNLDESKGQEEELEVTWGVGLQEKADKKAEELRRVAAGLGEKTPFEQMMERKLERKKQKKAQRQKRKEEQHNGEEAFSDDELPEELADLKEEMIAAEANSSKKRSKKKKGTKIEDNEMDSKQKAELELLLMDEELDESRHFNLDTRSTKSKKKKEQILQQDDFKVNVEDPRFEAIYTSHHYNVDPTDKYYRHTPGTQAFVNEKLNRRQIEDEHVPTGATTSIIGLDTNKRKCDAELSMMVRHVKQKTQQSMSKRKKAW